MAYRSTWLIGSVLDLEVQDLTISGSAEQVAAGSYYLYDASTALSLLAQVEAAMTAAGLASASAVLLRTRKVRLSAGAAFSIVWNDTRLRDLLGFSQGNVAGQASYVANSISPLLWSPGTKPAAVAAPLDVSGHKQHLVNTAVAPYTGRMEATSHGAREFNRYTWLNISKARLRTSSVLGGEWQTFFDEVVVKAAPHKNYREVQEENSGTTVATFDYAPHGPYQVSPERRALGWEFARSKGFEVLDRRYDLTIPVHVCPELG